MVINITDQIRISPALPLRRTAFFSGSTLPLELVGIPDKIGSDTVAAVAVTIVNADGMDFSASAVQGACGHWLVAFGPSCFPAYGYVSKGVKITATLQTPAGASRSITLAVGDLDIISDSATARQGDPSNVYVRKGADWFIKSETVGGVQHYKRVVLVYDDDMAAWGFDPQGDYTIGANGDFVEVAQ